MTKCSKLVTRIEDSHANVVAAAAPASAPALGELPFVVRWVEGRPVAIRYTDPVSGPASGVRLGDVIERIDGQPVDSLVAVWRPYTSASNEAKRLLDIASRLMRGAPGPVRLTVSRPEGDVTLVADRPAVTATRR